MENQIALATLEGYIRFDNGSVMRVPEARDASVFSDRRQANLEAIKHGVRGGYIMVDVAEELNKMLIAA